MCPRVRNGSDKDVSLLVKLELLDQFEELAENLEVTLDLWSANTYNCLHTNTLLYS